jgi:hypothetical protein
VFKASFRPESHMEERCDVKLSEGVPFFPRGVDVIVHVHILHLFCRNVYKT